MPVGPQSLWDENATKSAPHACTSVTLWGTYWQASTIVSAPTAAPACTSWRTGVSVPSTLDCAVIERTFAPSRSASRFDRSS